MGELEQTPIDPSINQPAPLADMTPESLMGEISKVHGQLANEAKVEPSIDGLQTMVNVVEPTPAVTVPAGQVATEQTPVPAPAVVPPAQKPDAVLPEVMAKKHFSSPEDLAKAYVELERNFHKSRQAPAIQPVAPAPIPVQTPSELPYSKDAFLQEFESDPVTTLAKMLSIVNAPLVETTRKQELRSKVLELSSSPDTATFNLPLVQEEITKVFTERPQLAENVTGNIADVYEMALGRLYRSGRLNEDAVKAGKAMAEQNFVQKQAAAVETSGKGVAPQPVKFDELSPDKQWEKINELFRAQKEEQKRGWGY